MRKLFVLFLWLFLLLFVVASLYISFTSYLASRDRMILANVSTFLLKVREGERRIQLPYPDQTVIVYTEKPSGERYMSANATGPLDRDKYSYVTRSLRSGTIYMYVRKIDPLDYLLFVSREPLYTGLLVASLLLYLSIFYFTVREFELAQGGRLTEEFLSRVKALRLTLATVKVLPEESVNEMKKVVDSILKYRPSKK